jgi:hypothetical protein
LIDKGFEEKFLHKNHISVWLFLPILKPFWKVVRFYREHKIKDLYVLRSWFRASFSVNIYIKCPTRCNTSILILLQDNYVFRVLAVFIIRSTITVVDSHWYNICYVR